MHPRDLSEVVVCPVCMLADGAVTGTCRVGHDEVEMVSMMPTSEHQAVQRSIANQREENRHLIRQLDEERSKDPEEVGRLKHQLQRANSALARSISRGQAAEAEREALRAVAEATFDAAGNGDEALGMALVDLGLVLAGEEPNLPPAGHFRAPSEPS